MRRRALLPGLLAALVALLPAATAAAAPGDPGPGRTLVVIGQSGIERADAFAATTGTQPAGAMWYLGLYEDTAAVQAVLDDIDEAIVTHPGLVVNVGVSFGALSTPSPPYTAAIAAGRFDDRIALLTAHLAAHPDTAYHLRLGYEFDLLGGQYGPPALYQAAYRHIVDRLRDAGVDNAAYVWHSAGAFWRATDASLLATNSGAVAKAVRDHAGPVDVQPIARFFPGADYVDAFGISYWQDSCCFGRSQQTARDVYEARTREILDQAAAMGLPVHVSESTPVYIGANSGAESVAWLDRTFDLVSDYDVRSLSVISIDWREGGFFGQPFWNGYWPDARIHAFGDTCRRWVDEAAGARYVHRAPSVPASCPS
jgi:hypothetical protein